MAARLVVAYKKDVEKKKAKRTDENMAELTRQETLRLFRNIGEEQVVHIGFIKKEMRIVFAQMGLGFRDEYLRNCLLTKDSPFAQYQNMIWIETAHPRISFFGRDDSRNRRRRK